MGKPKKRVAPRVANHVNRDLDRLMVRCIAGAVREIEAPWERNVRGRPCWNPRIVAICCFLKVFLNRSYDGTESYVKGNMELCNLLHVKSLPGHSVIARGMEQMSMGYIRRVNRHITMQARRRGIDVVVDSSGFSLKSSSKWFDIRIRRVSERKDHLKLHIVVDAETLAILHFTITGGTSSDSKEFKRLMATLPSLGKVAGDKAYSSRDNCQNVADKGGTPYLCFKTNSTYHAKGKPAWKISFHAYNKDTEEWMDTYHFRSIVEAVFSSIKHGWGPDIKSKRGWHQRRELSIKVLAYNIKRMLYKKRAEELGISLWTVTMRCQPNA